MYLDYFHLSESPFSITPDPAFLYPSPRHQEAMAHLLYSLKASGFVMLTGEVGTGKTTIVRGLVGQMPEEVDLAVILNPMLSARELLCALCDDLSLPYPAEADLKILIDTLNHHLLKSHAQGRKTVLLIDEAQNLSVELLEQIRLLTNLETAKEKLLQIILVGQPELRETLARPDLRQLSQRITARYHILPLTRQETAAYVQHRLKVAGRADRLFTTAALAAVHKRAGGVPRLINKICDRALLGAFARGHTRVDARLVRQAAAELLDEIPWGERLFKPSLAVGVLILLLLAGWYGKAPLQAFFTPAIQTAGESLAPPSGTARGGAPVASVPAPAAPPAVVAAPAPALAPAAAPAPETTVPPPVGTGPLSQPAPVETVLSPQSAPVETAAPPLVAPSPAAETLPVPLATSPAPRTARESEFENPLSALFDPARAQTAWDASFRLLFSLWRVEMDTLPQGSSACLRVEKAGLSCLHRTGNWSMLRQINRPAILSLVGPGGIQVPAVVSRMEGSMVTLQLPGRQIRLPSHQVDPFWYGKFTFLWRPPPLGQQIIKEGDRSRDVRWVRKTLDRVQGAPQPAQGPEDLFDSRLTRRVMGFQRQHKLHPDGIVGVMTLMKLVEQLKPNDPERPPLLGEGGP